MAMRLTLTFDNGPTPGVTDRVLDILAERKLRTTFFVVGLRLRDPARRALAERAFAEGHWIGNHTLTHGVQLGQTTEAGAPGTEIGAAQELIGALAHPDRLFRPYGAGGVLDDDLLSAAAVRYLETGGYSCVLWSSVPGDWIPAVDWVERCLSDVRAQDWPLVVLHDVEGCALARLPELLDRLAEMGVEPTQELPEACVPIRRGVVRGPLDHLVKRAQPGSGC
jgi:peptidoglycan/xylan/chitin deacetylase (PgdA/CDA1 family)